MPIIVVCNVFRASGILREVPLYILNASLILREMHLIVLCNVFHERLAFCGKYHLSSWVHDWGACVILREMPCIVLSAWLRSVWHFAGNAFYRPKSMIEELLAFYEKCLLLSWVHDWGASGILREMPFIVLSPGLRSVWHFAGNAFHICVPSFWRAFGILRENPLIVRSSCLRSVWHFAGNAFYHPV